MTTATRILSPDDLWNMPGNGEGFELVRGEFAMAPSGHGHSSIGANLLTEINHFVRKNKLGVVTGADGGFILGKDPDTVRAPDIGFVSASRVSTGKRTVQFFKGAPDLAAEIISPSDVYQDVDEKVREFLDAGTQLVWVINPRRKSVSVFRSDNSVASLRATDALDGEGVLPGFKVIVETLFN